MARYKLWDTGLGTTEIIDTEKGHHIPRDEKNGEFREFKEWEDEGNTPDPADN